MCDKLNLPKTTASYTRLERIHYQFGQKLIREGDHKIFWATDSNYTFETSHKSRRRRDIVLCKGPQPLCGEAVCFLKISNMGNIPIPTTLSRDSSSTDLAPTLTFILLRWFTPDLTHTFERDSLNRPLCVGPLHTNHCLWRYAKTSTNRKSISKDVGTPNNVFYKYRYMFGRTHDEQMGCFEIEKDAYYGLVSPDTVIRSVCMSPCFRPDTSTPDFGLWLETVTYH